MKRFEVKTTAGVYVFAAPKGATQAQCDALLKDPSFLVDTDTGRVTALPGWYLTSSPTRTWPGIVNGWEFVAEAWKFHHFMPDGCTTKCGDIFPKHMQGNFNPGTHGKMARCKGCSSELRFPTPPRKS